MTKKLTRRCLGGAALVCPHCSLDRVHIERVEYKDSPINVRLTMRCEAGHRYRLFMDQWRGQTVLHAESVA